MARNKITKEMREVLRNLRDAGVSDADIGRKFGITRERVAQILGRKGALYPVVRGKAARKRSAELAQSLPPGDF